MYPNSTKISGTAGRIRYRRAVSGPLPGGAWAVTGRSRRSTANSRITTMPDTNSGTATEDNPTIVMSRSRIRPRFSAATIPPKIPSGTTITNATTASFSEFQSAGSSRDETDCWKASDVPRLPVRMPPTQLPYWATSGRSAPNCLLSCATALALAKGPRIRRPTSPGSTCRPRKTMIDSNHSVRIAKPKRRSRKRPTDSLPSGLQAGPRETDVTHPGRLDPADCRLRRRHVVVEVGEHDRRVVQEQMFDLLRYRLLRVDVEGRDVLLHQRVVRGVLVMGRVPGPRGEQRRAEHDVRDAAVAVAGDPHG